MNSVDDGGDVGAILFNPLILLGFAIGFFMLLQVIRAATARNPTSVDGMTSDGRKLIPLRATFTGVRGLPKRLALASNNASPLLLIDDGGIEFRVIRRKAVGFDEIENVDYDQWRGDSLLRVVLKGRRLTFMATVQRVSDARRALRALPKSVQLAPGALALLRDEN